MPGTMLPQDGSVVAFYDVMSDLRFPWVVLFLLELTSLVE